NTDPKRPIGADSVGQWRRLLSSQAEADVLRLAGDLNERVAGLSPPRGVRRVLQSIGRAARRLTAAS
ncbi:MAG TPA: hypothetical protein VFA26_24005, partial [Gemmataceae bacterium]|nr:hypothetical protein [Gemmataceae bacterium]